MCEVREASGQHTPNARNSLEQKKDVGKRSPADRDFIILFPGKKECSTPKTPSLPQSEKVRRRRKVSKKALH